MMKFDIVKQARLLNVMAAVCLAAVGVLGLLLPDFSQKAGNMLIGIMCIVVGCAKLIGYFSNDLYRLAFEFDLGIGLVSVILGILFLVLPGKFDEMVPNTVSIYAMIESMLKLQIAMDARRFGMRYWLMIFLGGLAVCVAGVITLIATCVDNMSADELLHVTLILLGTSNALITAYTVRVRARKKKFGDWLADGNYVED